MVRHPAQAQRAVALAGALALAAVVAACGGGSKSDATAQATTRSDTRPKLRAIRKDLGADYRLADCRDWRRGGPAARRGTIEELRGFAGGPVDAGRGNVLTMQEAYRLFQNWCSQPYAKYFKLYKLYTRAAAFVPQG